MIAFFVMITVLAVGIFVSFLFPISQVAVILIPLLSGFTTFLFERYMKKNNDGELRITDRSCMLNLHISEEAASKKEYLTIKIVKNE